MQLAHNLIHVYRQAYYIKKGKTQKVGFKRIFLGIGIVITLGKNNEKIDMSDILTPLREKEKELRAELERTPLFRQLEALRATISLFEGKEHIQSHRVVIINPNAKFAGGGFGISDHYSSEMTWNEKVFYALSKLGESTVSGIVEYLKMQGAVEDEEFLKKRIGVIASKLNVTGKIRMRAEGRKGFYSLIK